MTWFASSANEAEADKEHYVMFLAVDADFTSGMIRMWSGLGDLIINGNTYLGGGEFVSASMPPERTNLVVERKTYRVAGVPFDAAIVSEADIDASFGRAWTEYFGFLHPETMQLIDTPEINFIGEMSNIRRVFGRDSMIEINVENELVILDQVDGWRFTHEHQQEFYPATTDLGFEQMPGQELKELLWGARPVMPGGGIGPGNRVGTGGPTGGGRGRR